MKSAVNVGLSLVFLFFALTGIGEAKLVVLSPHEMVEKAPYIIVGEIKSRSDTREFRQVVVNIQANLKGNIPEDQITMQYGRSQPYGWLGADFPAPGTKVILFLTGAEVDNKYTLYGDLNNIGVINNDRTVTLYKGAQKINGMTKKEYEQVYTKFLNEKYKGNNLDAPGENSNQQRNQETRQADRQESPTRNGSATLDRKQDVDRTGLSQNTLLVITGLLFGVLFITFAVIKMRKR